MTLKEILRRAEIVYDDISEGKAPDFWEIVFGRVVCHDCLATFLAMKILAAYDASDSKDVVAVIDALRETCDDIEAVIAALVAAKRIEDRQKSQRQ